MKLPEVKHPMVSRGRVARLNSGISDASMVGGWRLRRIWIKFLEREIVDSH